MDSEEGCIVHCMGSLENVCYCFCRDIHLHQTHEGNYKTTKRGGLCIALHCIALCIEWVSYETCATETPANKQAALKSSIFSYIQYSAYILFSLV